MAHIIHVSGSKFVPNEGALVEVNGSYFHNSRRPVEFSGTCVARTNSFGGSRSVVRKVRGKVVFYLGWPQQSVGRRQMSLAVLLRSAQGTEGCLWDTVITPLCGEGNAKYDLKASYE